MKMCGSPAPRRRLLIILKFWMILSFILWIYGKIDVDFDDYKLPRFGRPNSRTSDDVMSRTCTRCNHLVFIKVHKCGSDSMSDILFRVGMANNLTFVLPRERWEISYYLGSNNWTNIIPPPPGKSFDMLTLHAVYDRPVLERLMPSDTAYVGIVREPLQQAHSAAHYFYSDRIPGENKMSTFLNDTDKFARCHRFLLNCMAYEMGLEKEYIHNETRINQHLKTLDKAFTLIMVLERMEESLVLLRRLLCWTFEDILFIAKNISKRKPVLSITEAEIAKHRRLSMADYMLYAFSVQRLQRQIDSQGPGFSKEVSLFKNVLEKLKEYCHSKSAGNNPFIIPATEWSSAITTSREKCISMGYNNLQMIKMAKKYQYVTLD